MGTANCCGAAAAGSPCAGCENDRLKERQAQDALSFSLQMVGASPNSVPFWDIATVADLYQRSPRGSQHSHTDHAVARTVGLASSFSDVLSRTRDVVMHGALAADDGAPLVFGGEDEPAGPQEEGKEGAERPHATPTTPYGTDLQDGDDWYDPRLPPGGGAGGGIGPRCEVERWDYPLSWQPIPPKGDLVNPEDRFVGFYFEARIEYKEDPAAKIYCMCCVFRQFLKRTVTTQIGTGSESTGRNPTGAWGRDRREGKEYGGSRKDKSTSDGKTAKPPDSPEGEAAQFSSECVLAFDDWPGQPASQLGLGTSELTYDFLGVVYDRCNLWAYVDSRRFLLTRKVTLGYDKSDEEASDEQVTEDESRGSRDVPSESAKDAWDHRKKDRDGRARPMPGTPMRPA